MKLAHILASKDTPERIVTVNCRSTVQEAVDLLCVHNIGALVVIDSQSGRMAGILTERDILRSLCTECPLTTARLTSTKVEDIMTRDVVCASLHEEARTVLATMTRQHIRHMPVMDGEKLVGIISHRDVIRELHQHTELRFRSSCDYLGGTYGLRVY